jgi:hypothetical protein
MKGGWRIVAGGPVILSAAIVIVAIVSAIQGASQFPILLLISGIPLLLYLLIVHIAFLINYHRRINNG